MFTFELIALQFLLPERYVFMITFKSHMFIFPVD